MVDASYPPGLQNYWKAGYLDELTDQGIETVLAQAPGLSSPLSSLSFEHLQGAMARPEEETAFSHRSAAFDFKLLSIWTEPDDRDLHLGWTHRTWEAMRPFASDGVYVNNLGDEGEERVRSAYGPSQYERLVRLKNAYDPDNVFRLNQNIRPTTWSDRRIVSGTASALSGSSPTGLLR